MSKLLALRRAFYPVLKDALSPGENVVQRILEVRRRLSEIAPNLFHVLFVRFLDLIAEELFERTVAIALVLLFGMIRNHVRHKGTR